jgi:sugar phosphate isomerase/epimerase
MVESLEQLTAVGVEWIAIHPYARIQRDGTVSSRPSAATAYLQRAVEIARTAGVHLFWKPHLAYWGSFGWRGEIDFGADEAAWGRFFEGYRRFIVDQARFAQKHGIEMLAVGVELEQTTQRESQWRQIIAAVREVYEGRLTYAANWDSLDRVPFWDAVDWIGVHAYFPLSLDQDPGREALWQGWQEPLRELAELSSRHGGKPILFAEIGYNRSRRAARAPWDAQMEEDSLALDLRQRLIEVALMRIEAEPFVSGMFWWKWIPGANPWDRDFSMRDPEALRALERYWGADPAAAGSAAEGVGVRSGE